MSVYKNIFLNKFGGYSGYTEFRSFGMEAGIDELCLSLELIKFGYYGYQLNDNYVRQKEGKAELSNLE
jgi:hypothetical protein